MGAGIAVTLVCALPALAQVPPYPPQPMPVAPLPLAPVPPSPETAEIAACLCLQQAVDALGADMNAKRGAYDASRDEVGRIDAQLQGARAALDVNNPHAVAQFRQLLDRRDAAWRQSSGPLFSAWSTAAERYNGRVNEFNGRCANRPRNPLLLNQVQATLACPPPY